MTIAINIRGTGGSGKSTVVRRIMELYPRHVEDRSMAGRNRPLFTEHWRADKPSLIVPGHYETACGGCDTIKTVDQVYAIVRMALRNGVGTVYEGIMVQDDVRRAVELSKEHTLHVIRLSTPIEECLNAIRTRRAERGDERPFSEKNTRGRYESVLRTCHRLKDAGVRVEVLDREAAFLRVRELLGV